MRNFPHHSGIIRTCRQLRCRITSKNGWQPAASAVHSAPAATPARFLDRIMPNATVLVVDDEALIRWSLTERLKSEGYNVLEAETGRAALEQVGEGVDLVLLDYRLPDTDGVSVLRKIKEIRSGHPGDPADGLCERRDRRRGDEARRLSLRQQAVQSRRSRGDGRARAGDDAAAPRGAAVPHERRPPVQPAAHRRRVGAGDGAAASGRARRHQPRPPPCC